MCDSFKELVTKAQAIADRAAQEMQARGHDPAVIRSAKWNRFEQEKEAMLSRMSPAKRARLLLERADT